MSAEGKPEVFYATSNPGKVAEVRDFLSVHGIELTSPADIGIELDVEETGETLEENATLKAKAWRGVPEVDGKIIMTDDTGIEIDALNGEPGIKVRRWDGSERMTDQAIIDMCLSRMKDISNEERTAQTRTVIALIGPEGELQLFDGTLRGHILEEPDGNYVEGFPFETIFFVDEWDMSLGVQRKIPVEERAKLETHRTRAVGKAVEAIKQKSA